MLFYKVKDGETDRRRQYRCNGCGADAWDTDAEHAGWQSLARMGGDAVTAQHYCPKCPVWGPAPVTFSRDNYGPFTMYSGGPITITP